MQNVQVGGECSERWKEHSLPETPDSPESVEPELTPTPTVRSTAAAKRAAAQAANAAKSADATASDAPAAAMQPISEPVAPAAPKRAVSLPVVAAIAVAALVGGVSGAGVSLWAVSLNDDDKTSTTSSPATVTVNDADNATTITAVAVKASASVVTISVSSGTSGGSGSGVVLTSDGYILTNTHVVTLEGATANPTVQVQTSDGRLLDATIVGTDPIADLAVIKVADSADLVPATFANSSKLNVGDTAIAIGAPLGLAGTVTNGIVSSLNRSIQIASSAVPDESADSGNGNGNGNGSGDSPFDFWQFNENGSDANTSTSTATISLPVIQTDAAINPGNSGGALLDSDGNVIGINVAIASAGSTSSSQSGSIGVGFAIPSNMAKRIADEIIATGSATHGLLGASVLDVTEDENSSDSGVVGAAIKEVVSGGAAEKAGLQVGDVITGFDGIHITGKTDLTAQVRALAAGASATVTYVRDGKTAEVSVTLGTLVA
jgi:putative serine protease PepD